MNKKEMEKRIEELESEISTIRSKPFFKKSQKRNIWIEVVTIRSSPEFPIEDFAIQYLSSMYPLAYIEKTNPQIDNNKGIPDLRVELLGDEFYVEVKAPNDSIRDSQIQWIINNPEKKVKFLFFKDGMGMPKQRTTKEILENPNDCNEARWQKENNKYPFPYFDKDKISENVDNQDKLKEYQEELEIVF